SCFLLLPYCYQEGARSKEPLRPNLRMTDGTHRGASGFPGAKEKAASFKMERQPGFPAANLRPEEFDSDLLRMRLLPGARKHILPCIGCATPLHEETEIQVRVLPAALLVLSSIPLAFAQETRGTIFGRVSDQLNAAIPAVAVVVTNTETNTVTTLRSQP